MELLGEGRVNDGLLEGSWWTLSFQSLSAPDRPGEVWGKLSVAEEEHLLGGQGRAGQKWGWWWCVCSWGHRLP